MTSVLNLDVFTRWTDLADDDITLALIDELLKPIDDDLWVCAACVDRTIDDVHVQRALLELGIQRTESAVKKAQIDSKQALAEEERENDEGSEASQHGEVSTEDQLSAYFSATPATAQLCRLRPILLGRLDRLMTYLEVSEKMTGSAAIENSDEGEEEWEDDPWAETNEAGPSTKPISQKIHSLPPLPLSVFMDEDPCILCFALATHMQFEAARVVVNRHWPALYPYRFEIINGIPLFADPSEYRDFLPAVDPNTGKELVYEADPWRRVPDWTETSEVQAALQRLEGFSAFIDEDQPLSAVRDPVSSSCANLLGADEISLWYRERVELTLSSTAMVDAVLSLVQHGVARGVLGLDELGEDLSLLSRLVYDAQKPDADIVSQGVSLSEWTSLEPLAIVHRFLAYSTSNTIVDDIRRLVMPYLFVLETRYERAGKPDPGLMHRLLYEFILSTSLILAVPIFEASKPTLVASQRLISDDEDLARLALAYLYGSDSLDAWSSMSAIFECLPAWRFDADGEEEDEADTTVTSLSTFLAPSTSRPRCSPSDLLMFFKPLPAKSLSRALDILDVHLESGEILARWGVPVPLRWFLQSARNEAQQRAWATKMARQVDAPSGDLNSEDAWLSLLDDMLKLSRPTAEPTNSAFGSLSAHDIRQIFFRGLLSTGRFMIAKRLVHSREIERLLDDDTIETLCLDCSREFYDNANSGNYNFGDMKLAYDCLTVARQSPAIQKEREFIEATSRIASFNVMTRPGVPITPLEIRLTKDKLSLVSSVLSSNESAYQHTEVILDLVRKLGFRNDALAEVKTLAMITDTALQAEDFDRAFEISERMVNAVFSMRQNSPFGMDNAQVKEAVEICWVACFQLGRQSEADDVDKKMALLGRALELCPPDRILDILVSWRKLETEDIEQRKEKTDERQARRLKSSKLSASLRGRTSTLASRLQNLHMPSPSLPSAPDAAAIASHAFSRVAASFPFSMHGRSSLEENRSRSREGSEQRSGSPDVSSQARHALQRGIGWLIGADENEL